MRIIFTESFKNECQDRFQITEEQAKQAITSPDKQIVTKIDDLDLRFFVKRMLEPENEYCLLICTCLENGNLLVNLAFRIHSELVEEVKTLDPIILLQQLALKFGLPIQIGHQVNKFIFRESIVIKPSDEQIKLAKIANVHNPANHSFIQSMFIKIKQQEDVNIAKCALVFCLDLNRYLPWLMGKKSNNKIIRKPGTVNFWVDPKKNPGAFTNGVNYRWIEFQLHGEYCIVKSEGKIIRAIMNPDTPCEVEIFSRPMDLDQKNRHMLTVTWSEDALTLYVDGQEEYQIQLD